MREHAMELMHFDPAPASSASRVRMPVITESLTVTTLPSQAKTHLLKDPGDWGWGELRDYVVSGIETRFGVFPRDAMKEAAIFKRFCTQYGTDAYRIAQYVFEICDGWWRNSPLSVQRFCVRSDPYFAVPILDALRS